MTSTAQPLWSPSPSALASTNLTRVFAFLKDRGLVFHSYAELYDWSVRDIPAFWAAFWDFAEIRHSRTYTTVIDDPGKMPGAIWFEGAHLNFAENLLRFRDDTTALVSHGEDDAVIRWTYGELFQKAAGVASSLRKIGIRPGDRVGAFMPNIPETVAAMLGAAAVGAVFSSSSPDFGIQGVLDRFGQIAPRVLFAAASYSFKGKKIDCMDKIRGIAGQIPSIEKIVITGEPSSSAEKGIAFDSFVDGSAREIEFEQLPFSHPVYVMYSSGTTGLPKCMVQGSGVMLNHLKELLLHTDLKRSDKIFYYTTCGWMMWNWLVSSLAVGSSVVLFDGNPFHPGPGRLWKMAQDEKVTIFGTSARYITALAEAGARPGHDYDLSTIQAVLSTGSPLSPEGFDYVYREIKKDVRLSSISGGTDLNGCFALGNPHLPVYRGEIQSRGLGMKVEIFDETGSPVRETKGELVCTRAFPSMPLYFWDDLDGKKYHNAYFDVFAGIWRHGDFAEITAHDGLVVYGRSDATLNPGGVRIGTADIYRQLETVPEIADSVVIGQDWQNDVRVVLFVKMKDGRVLDEDLKARIRKSIKDGVSPRHVPDRIVAVADIPYTLNMKKVELAVRNVVHNRPVTNRDALLNPESLEFFKDIPDLQK